MAVPQGTRTVPQVSGSSKRPPLISRADKRSGYYPSQAQDPNTRSMSTLFPLPLSSNLGDHRRVEEREFARQRRRNSHENRRQSKMRVRRTRLPSIMDAGLGSAQVTGGLVDSFLAAPLTYVNDHATPSYDPNTRGGYGVVSG